MDSQQVGLFYNIGGHITFPLHAVFPQCKTLDEVRKLPHQVRKELLDRYLFETCGDALPQALLNNLSDNPLENLQIEYLEGFENDDYPVLCYGDVSLFNKHGYFSSSDLDVILDPTQQRFVLVLKDGVVESLRLVSKFSSSMYLDELRRVVIEYSLDWSGKGAEDFTDFTEAQFFDYIARFNGSEASSRHNTQINIIVSAS